MPNTGLESAPGLFITFEERMSEFRKLIALYVY